MSKDQLSWDQILKGAMSDASQSAHDEAASEPVKAEEPPAKKAKSTRTKKTSSKADKADTKTDGDANATEKASAKTSSAKDGEQLFSKKDWSKLEFPQSSPASAPAETQAKSTEATTTVSVQKTQISVATPTTELQVASSRVTVSESRKPVSAPMVAEEDDELFSENEEPAKNDEPNVITVSELNRHIRDILEGRFPMIWVKAEISNFKAHTSGHFYFSLKDAKAQINAVMFRGFNSQLRFRPEDGMEVLVRGKITVYEPRGNYQIFCEVMEPVGAGALQKAFEQLKAKLQKEGLFDAARKRPLPALPKHIAIVTSPTGAAIRDMLNVLGRRFKGVNITVVPCKVQGDQAPREIIAAIQLAQQMSDVDVMIVGRGGGSIEDLWAFNDEGVARAIAACRVPVISAVGHEVDFTIADFVADLRAPTPSAAAELVVKNAADLTERVANLSKSLRLALLRSINMARQSATALSKRLVDPQRRIQDASMRCDELRQRMDAAIARLFDNRRLQMELLKQRLGTPLPRIEREREAIAGFDVRLRSGMRNTLLRKREGLQRNMALIDSLSPLKVLDRGYSMVVKGNEIVTDATGLAAGDTVTVRMCKGSFEAEVKKIEGKR